MKSNRAALPDPEIPLTPVSKLVYLKGMTDGKQSYRFLSRWLCSSYEIVLAQTDPKMHEQIVLLVCGLSVHLLN